MIPVAVITRTLDRPAFLERAIRSVLGQTFGQWEQWIVNDGGDPAPVDALIERYREAHQGRIRALHLDANQGMQRASNLALERSTSRYVAIHDDDDSWDPRFLERCVDFLEQAGPDSRYQGVITKTLRIDERAGTDGTLTEVARTPYVPIDQVSLFRVGFENPFPPIALLYRRNVHQAIGLFNERYGMAADMDFNFRFLLHHDIHVIDEPLAFYHWRVDAGPDGSGTGGNTFTRRKREHDRLINELRNDWLRGETEAGTPSVRLAGLAFSLSKFLYENEWLTWYLKDKADALVSRAETTEDLARQNARGERLERALELLDTNSRTLDELREGVAANARSERLERALELLDTNSRTLDELQENLGGALDALGAIATEQGALGADVRRKFGFFEEVPARLERLESLTSEIRDRQRGQRTLVRLGPLVLSWRRRQ